MYPPSLLLPTLIMFRYTWCNTRELYFKNLTKQRQGRGGCVQVVNKFAFYLAVRNQIPLKHKVFVTNKNKLKRGGMVLF